MPLKGFPFLIFKDVVTNQLSLSVVASSIVMVSLWYRYGIVMVSLWYPGYHNDTITIP